MMAQLLNTRRERGPGQSQLQATGVGGLGSSLQLQQLLPAGSALLSGKPGTLATAALAAGIPMTPKTLSSTMAVKVLQAEAGPADHFNPGVRVSEPFTWAGVSQDALQGLQRDSTFTAAALSGAATSASAHQGLGANGRLFSGPGTAFAAPASAASSFGATYAAASVSAAASAASKLSSVGPLNSTVTEGSSHRNAYGQQRQAASGVNADSGGSAGEVGSHSLAAASTAAPRASKITWIADDGESVAAPSADAAAAAYQQPFGAPSSAGTGSAPPTALSNRRGAYFAGASAAVGDGFLGPGVPTSSSTPRYRGTELPPAPQPARGSSAGIGAGGAAMPSNFGAFPTAAAMAGLYAAAAAAGQKHPAPGDASLFAGSSSERPH